jgi:predicted Fe-S protein YdhL (DUF1289 family)
MSGAPRVVPLLRSGEPVPSPCTSVCRMDPRTRWCEGCWRTLDEIAGWSTLDDAAKRAVWQQLALRRAGQATAEAQGGADRGGEAPSR